MHVNHALIAITMVAGTGAAAAQSAPDTDAGRYTLAPVSGGAVRLDTRSGAVSTCTDKGNGWACTMMPDERAALDTEIGRLQADNDRLKAELAQRPPTVTGKIDDALPKADSLKPAEPKTADGQRKIEIPKIEIPLPSGRDVDRVMDFVESAWRRLVEIANRMQRDAGGKI